LGVETLDAVADRGYNADEEIRACEEAGITVTLPKPMTSNSKAAGRFGNHPPRSGCGARVVDVQQIPMWGDFFIMSRNRLMTSAARMPLSIMASTELRPSSRLGGSWASQRKQALPWVTNAASG
jgi:hypothetical protein